MGFAHHTNSDELGSHWSWRCLERHEYVNLPLSGWQKRVTAIALVKESTHVAAALRLGRERPAESSDKWQKPDDMDGRGPALTFERLAKACRLAPRGYRHGLIFIEFRTPVPVTGI